ncbi:MAG: hypothetical protein ACR2N4_18055 [Jatrophihabitans sp.]
MAAADTLHRVHRLYRAFQSGELARLAKHEVAPVLAAGSRQNYLYFTLPVCLNYQRNSPALWQAALDTWDDPATRFVFFPEQVARRPVEQSAAALIEHRLALQTQRHPWIWTTVCRTLHEHFDDDPRQLIARAGNDILSLRQLLQVQLKAGFPYLSGDKLSNYWAFILMSFTDVRFDNPEEISIIPDTHVIKSSVRLGVVPAEASPGQVARAWRELLVGSELLPVQLHPVLWHWSRAGFLPAV